MPDVPAILYLLTYLGVGFVTGFVTTRLQYARARSKGLTVQEGYRDAVGYGLAAMFLWPGVLIGSAFGLLGYGVYRASMPAEVKQYRAEIERIMRNDNLRALEQGLGVQNSAVDDRR